MEKLVQLEDRIFHLINKVLCENTCTAQLDCVLFLTNSRGGVIFNLGGCALTLLPHL